MANEPNPIEFLRNRFATRLNEHYESQRKAFSIDKESILFTDWKGTEEIRQLGILGVDAVKEKIRHGASFWAH